METTKNDLKSFKVYVDNQLANPESNLSKATTGVQYTYDLDMLVYTKSTDGKIIRSDSQELLQDLLLEHFGMDLAGMMSMGSSFGMSMSAPKPSKRVLGSSRATSHSTVRQPVRIASTLKSAITMPTISWTANKNHPHGHTSVGVAVFRGGNEAPSGNPMSLS